jgi:predicted  nucleic acid-binding Zn-ribbon protein
MAKKTTTVETPIDKRETFVSIRKKFADSADTISEKLNTLYQLQLTDTAIDRIVRLRGELPLEVETLENELEQINGKIANINLAIDEQTESIANNKAAIVEGEAMLEKYKEQENQISNSREYDAINKEIENQELLILIAKKRIDEAKNTIASLKERLEIANDKKTIVEEDLAAKKNDLETIIESTAKEEEVLREKREACAKKIDERTMTAYDRIRESNNNHLAVVGVYEGKACGGCMHIISPQRLIDIASGKKLVICEFCGRILVNAENE